MAKGHQGKAGKPVQKVWYLKGTNDVLTRVRRGVGRGTMIWATRAADGSWKNVPDDARELRADLLDLKKS